MIKSGKALKTISWNGITLRLPAAWESRIQGNAHLSVEYDFEPRFEIRWQKAIPRKKDEIIDRVLRQIEEQLKTKLSKTAIPESIRTFTGDFETSAFVPEKRSHPLLLMMYDAKQQTLVIVQIQSTQRDVSLWQDGAIHCRVVAKQTLWAIQDFQVNVPRDFEFHSYSIQAGLTLLQFHSNRRHLHLIRLAPATARLNGSSLEEILHQLTGEDVASKSITREEHGVLLHRTPSIFHQIVLRMRRKKPFLLAKIWHDTVNDRMLSVCIESLRPIDREEHSTICSSYEIFPQTTTSLNNSGTQ